MTISEVLNLLRREQNVSVRDHRRVHVAHEKAHEQAHRQQSEIGSSIRATYEERFRLEEKARDLAMTAMDKRIEDMNQFRNQLRDQQANFVTLSLFDSKVGALEKSYDELKLAITNIEKGDIGQQSRGEGRTIGQGLVIAAIMGTVSFVGVILGILVVVVNVITGK